MLINWPEGWNGVPSGSWGVPHGKRKQERDWRVTVVSGDMAP